MPFCCCEVGVSSLSDSGGVVIVVRNRQERPRKTPNVES